MTVLLLGLVAGAVCLLAAVAVSIVAWRLFRPAPTPPLDPVTAALVDALVHAMRTGPAVEGKHAERANALGRAGRFAEALEVAAEWERAGGMPTNRGAFNDVRRALESLI
jgi:hypothetical protein